MAMHLIIDGYNLLGARGQVGREAGAASESAREQLLRDLSGYRQRKGHPITVVFDGWQQGIGTERREHRAGIEVVYSRRGERADQVIQRLAEEFGRDCAVVSSDREVADFARAQGAFVISSPEFESRLRAVPPALSSASFKPVDRDEEVPRRVEKKGNARKLPKALRKRNRQLRGF
jgi:predicted RNA-binding protein with PIN domain